MELTMEEPLELCRVGLLDARLLGVGVGGDHDGVKTCAPSLRYVKNTSAKRENTGAIHAMQQHTVKNKLMR
jgi:hypothetical protein